MSSGVEKTGQRRTPRPFAPTVRPRPLAPRDTIALVSPSGPAAARFPERLARARAALEAEGFVVRLLPGATASGDLTAGSIEQRVADLHAAFADDEVGAIVTTIGGNLSAQLIEHLDWDLVRAHPKAFCGFSDTTSLHLALALETGLSTFYGPAALPNWGEVPAPQPETVQAFRRAVLSSPLVGALPVPARHVVEHVDWDRDRARSYGPHAGPVVLRGGSAEGRLFVGCLPVLARSIGTPWEPDLAGCLVVLDLPGAGYGLGAAASDLLQLRTAGVLDDVALVGLTIPDPTSELEGLGRFLVEIAPSAVPLVSGLALGHSSPMLTVPLGAPARFADATIELLGDA